MPQKSTTQESERINPTPYNSGVAVVQKSL